jgi:exosome complex RNA-binding protein Csl4
VTKSADGKFKGTLRYSVISKTYSTIEPKAGDIIEGNVTEIKNDRALIKL